MNEPLSPQEIQATRSLPHRWWVPVVRVSTALLLTLAAAWGLLLWLTWTPGTSWRGPPAPLTGEQHESLQRLQHHVRALAVDIGPRHIGAPSSMRRAEEFIGEQLRADGYDVQLLPVPNSRGVTHNIQAQLTGSDLPDQIIVVGAHYDTISTTPGADDNATGVAAVLEIAHLMRSSSPSRTVRFVLFTHEEPPYFRSDGMGSAVYARQARREREQIVAMYSLEMLGYFSEQPDSQTLPPPLHLVFPTTGNFVAFISLSESQHLVHESVGLFREHARIASEALSAPAWVTGVDFSDHAPFIEQGYDAVMVTDTAFMRNANYHRATDTADTLQYPYLTHATLGMRSVVEALADK